jgi:hypothetical protein
MNHKKKAFSKYKICKCIHHWDRFARVRNKLRQLIRHFIADYEDNLALNIKDNPKRFCRYASANCKFAEQNICFQLLSGLPRVVEHPMPKIYITMDKSKKRLSKLDPNNTKGPYGIHPRILKELADIVAKLFCLLFKLSRQNSSLPADRQKAIITLILKKGSRTQPENYQPISPTLVVAKLLKGIVNDTIIAHMTKNSLLFGGQHGFRKDMV